LCIRPFAQYLVFVNSDEREEIAASVAAHAELGPRYEDAVAEGLVERIGAEIDKRVDARLRGMGSYGSPSSVPQQAPAHPAPPPVPQAPPAPQPVPQPSAAAAVPARRSGGATVAALFLAFGSMGLGVGATAVVAANMHATLGGVICIVVIWIAIMSINVENAKRH
jgi:hypothetical protein